MLYFTFEELNPHKYQLTEAQQANLTTLIERVSKIREAWGKPMIVTSGIRSQADQLKINPNAPLSKHILGAAVDIADVDGSLKAWLKDNEQLLIDAELWCEAAESTATWWHAQIFPPKSGTRWFKP